MILTNNVKVIQPDQIKSINVEVSNKISENNLESFCKTHLELNGFKPTFATKIIPIFQPSQNTYEIYFFDCYQRCVTFFILILEFLKTDFKDAELILVSYNDAFDQKYLIAFQKNQLLMFKKISNQTPDMSVAMFEKKFQLKIDSFVELESHFLDIINPNKIREKFLKVKKSPIFATAVSLNIIIFLLFFVFAIFGQQSAEDNLKNQIQQTQKQIAMLQFHNQPENIVEKIKNLCNILSENKILIDNITYEKKQIVFDGIVDSNEKMKLFSEDKNLILLKTETNQNEEIKFTAKYL